MIKFPVKEDPLSARRRGTNNKTGGREGRRLQHRHRQTI